MAEQKKERFEEDPRSQEQRIRPQRPPSWRQIINFKTLCFILPFIIALTIFYALPLKKKRFKEKDSPPQITKLTAQAIKTFCGSENVDGEKIIFWSKEEKKYLRLKIPALFQQPDTILIICIDDSNELFLKHLSIPETCDTLFVTAYYHGAKKETILFKRLPLPKGKKGFYITIKHLEEKK